MALKHFIRGLKISALALSCAALPFAQAQAQSLLRDTEIEETLSEFTDPLLRVAGLSPSSVDLYLVNDPSLNAFVTRGQNIFLHSGLILEAENPNQLKGVIAHETGHIVGGHIVRSDYGQRSAYGSMLVAAGLGLAAILAGETSAGALILGGSSQFGTLEILSYSRVNESTADQYAANFMEATGQSGKGLIEFLKNSALRKCFHRRAAILISGVTLCRPTGLTPCGSGLRKANTQIFRTRHKSSMKWI